MTETDRLFRNAHQSLMDAIQSGRDWDAYVYARCVAYLSRAARATAGVWEAPTPRSRVDGSSQGLRTDR